ncbi:hypothetical protein F5Y15DRAFT_387083 [Xylariaceae sp. FL0016]|nr:hypothetical protein F5Y15DRAFT_387083 [Xylariaceae sp. FL0016]
MPGDYHYSSSTSGRPPLPPPPPPGYDSYQSHSFDYPPPPSSTMPDRRCDNRRYGSDWSRARDQDRYVPQDYRNDRQNRGPYSGLRQTSSDALPRDYRDRIQPPQGDFTFRMERPAGVTDSYVPSGSRGLNRDYQRRSGRQENEHSGRRDRNTRGRRGGPYQRGNRKASDRLLLSKKHDENAELMLGDASNRAKYRDVDDMSDSDDAAMEISDNSDSGPAEPVSKRARHVSSNTSEEQQVPKWSNPDPYTALPPPENSRKTKDMVHLIRKARIEADEKKSDAPKEAADFISFDLSEDEDYGTVASAGRGVPNAPTGPRAAAATTNTLPSSLPPKPPPSHQDTLPAPPSQASFRAINSRQPKPTGKNAPVDLTPSTSLGNRKRTADDQIKLPHTSLKKFNKMAAPGVVVPEWTPVSDSNPCPWSITDHSATALMGTRLHKEIRDFYEYVRPRDFEHNVRQQMLERLTKVIKQRFPDAEIRPFGSFMSGLYLPTADMDIALCSRAFVRGGRPKYDAKKSLYHLRAHLQSHGVPYLNEVEVIAKAKVPLVKFTDSLTALKVDISFEKLDGHNAIQTFLDWKAKYPVMPILVAVIKHFLLMRGLNEPGNGGIGGFSVICMVVNLLHQMPQVQSGNMNPEHHLNELLMEFLDLYGNKFHYETVAISMNPPRFINKNDVSSFVYRNMDRLSIIDPNNPANDIAGGSANIKRILNHFSDAHALLEKRMHKLAKNPDDPKDKYATILGPLLGGNYGNFDGQREWMEKVNKDGLPHYSRGGNSFDSVQW